MRNVFRVNVGFAIALLALAVVGYQSYRTPEAISAAGRLRGQLRQDLILMKTMESSLKDAETGQRGFLLTGKESYLKPYLTAKDLIPTQMAELEKNLEANPSQQQRLRTLEPLIEKKDE